MKTLNDIAKESKKFYETNYEKLKEYVINFSDDKLNNYKDSDLYTLEEIISALIYMKVNEDYTEYLLDGEYDFTPPFHNFDVGNKDTMVEIKCRRPSIGSNILYKSPALLKLCKYEFAKPHLNRITFKYINIFHDRIFIYDLNKMQDDINMTIQLGDFKTIYTDNKKGNQNSKFIPLDYRYAHEIEFSNTVKKEVKDLFNLIERIEILKQNRNKPKFK